MPTKSDKIKITIRKKKGYKNDSLIAFVLENVLREFNEFVASAPEETAGGEPKSASSKDATPFDEAHGKQSTPGQQSGKHEEKGQGHQD